MEVHQEHHNLMQEDLHHQEEVEEVEVEHLL
jgi:hypothetical protein